MLSLSRIRAASAAAIVCALAPAAAAHAADGTVTSFDGTSIVTHTFMSATGGAAPTILEGPGWAGAGETDPSAPLVKGLTDAGYNVVTWAPRGFGASGGTVSIDTPSIEGRDVSSIIDWVATQPWAQLDGPGDPRVGMAGGSYGGGIQYSTAIADHRLDALVPVVGWFSLTSALYKENTFKQGWDTLLYQSGLGAANATPPGLDPHITSAFNEGTRTGVLSNEDRMWFAERGPGKAVRAITTPTMVVGGTPDTLFPLDEDINLYNTIKSGGAPVKMVWFCGGHGTCLTGTGDPGGTAPATLSLNSQHLTSAMMAWFAKYLKKDNSADTGPGFEWLADDAKWRSAAAWPAPSAGSVVTTGKGTLKITKGYVSGQATAATPVKKASQALSIKVKVSKASQLVGAPTLSITYTGKAAKGASTATKVFAQIVDDKRHIVVGNQVTPLEVFLDGRPRRVTRQLDPIAASAAKGTTYTLQIISSSKVWAPQRSAGTLKASAVKLTLPAVKG
jgi:ABC-2 type transport system ATP-binding protein